MHTQTAPIHPLLPPFCRTIASIPSTTRSTRSRDDSTQINLFEEAVSMPSLPCMPARRVVSPDRIAAATFNQRTASCSTLGAGRRQGGTLLQPHPTTNGHSLERRGLGAVDAQRGGDGSPRGVPPPIQQEQAVAHLPQAKRAQLHRQERKGQGGHVRAHGFSIHSHIT